MISGGNDALFLSFFGGGVSDNKTEPYMHIQIYMYICVTQNPINGTTQVCHLLGASEFRGLGVFRDLGLWVQDLGFRG